MLGYELQYLTWSIEDSELVKITIEFNTEEVLEDFIKKNTSPKKLIVVTYISYLGY